ncbi:MAG: polysaccharide deacetylase family protein [Thermomicrobiales bacterium]
MFRPRLLRLIVAGLLCLQMGVGPIASAQDGAWREGGKVVGTTGLNVRACPKASCESVGLAQLRDDIIVTGEAENGFLPVEWKGKAGWAWALYVATPSTGTPFLIRGTPGCDRVAFLFNIGIGDEMQMGALEWLADNDVPATIFPMGWWAQANPDDMKEMADLGFLIGTHGDTRGNLPQYSDDDILKDLKDSQVHIEAASGQPIASYFTPYAADMDDRVRSIVAGAGFLPVAWDVSAADYGPDIDADYVFERVAPNVMDGTIVEFHLDGPASAQSTAIALPWLVENLRNKGYTFVTIQDMAQPCGAPIPEKATPQTSATAAQSASPVVPSGTPASTTTP